MPCHKPCSEAACRNRRCTENLLFLRGLGTKEDEAAVQKAQEEEARARRQKEEAEAELQRQRELEEADRLRQLEAEKVAERKRRELEERETEAVRKAGRRAKRPLNVFEERRVRRQVRSEHAGGSPSFGQVREDWSSPLRPEVRAQLDDAVKFFSETVRVPATLIGSAALGTLFLPPFKWAFYEGALEEQQLQVTVLWRLYVLLTAGTFCAELTCVLGTSNAHAQLLELGRGGLALEPSAMDLIMSHIEFEYLQCSLSFLGGVAAFMLATFCRVLAVFRYSKSVRTPRQPELCVAVGGMMLSSLLWWLYLANVRLRLMEFGNLGAMAFRYGQLLWARIRLGEVGFFGFSALLVAGTSAAVTIHMLLAPAWKRRCEGRLTPDHKSGLPTSLALLS